VSFILSAALLASMASVGAVEPGVPEGIVDACAVAFAFSPPQDCLAQMLQPTSSGLFAPSISDNNTAMGTNGVGCDGCTVSWDVTVTWWHTGQGVTVVNGVRQTHSVTPGSVTVITMNAAQDMKCASEATVTARNPGGGGATMVVRCRACQ
jgi:hypothetical protein